MTAILQLIINFALLGAVAGLWLKIRRQQQFNAQQVEINELLAKRITVQVEVCKLRHGGKSQ